MFGLVDYDPFSVPITVFLGTLIKTNVNIL